MQSLYLGETGRNLLSLQWSEPELITMEVCNQASERESEGSLMGGFHMPVHHFGM